MDVSGDELYDRIFSPRMLEALTFFTMNIKPAKTKNRLSTLEMMALDSAGVKVAKKETLASGSSLILVVLPSSGSVTVTVGSIFAGLLISSPLEIVLETMESWAPILPARKNE